jgi:hypothetical protein
MMPPCAAPPDLLDRLITYTQQQTFTTVCTVAAVEFRALARDAYDRGDARRGAQMTARALAWEMAADSGDLSSLHRGRP